MYINTYNTNNTFVLFVFIAFYALLIVPFLIKVKLIIGGKDKIFSLKVFLFNLVKIFNCKLFRKKLKLYLGINGKKRMVNKEDIFGLNSKVKPLNDYHVLSIKFTYYVSENNQILLPFTINAMTNSILSIFKSVLFYKKPYFKIKNEIITKSQNTKLNVNCVFILNLLMIFLSVVKIITGKIYARK